VITVIQKEFQMHAGVLGICWCSTGQQQVHSMGGLGRFCGVGG